MFNLEDALAALNGSQLTIEQLRNRLAMIRLEHMEELPPEVDVDDLIKIALDRDWITEDASGAMKVETRNLVSA